MKKLFLLGMCLVLAVLSTSIVTAYGPYFSIDKTRYGAYLQNNQQTERTPAPVWGMETASMYEQRWKIATNTYKRSQDNFMVSIRGGLVCDTLYNRCSARQTQPRTPIYIPDYYAYRFSRLYS